MITIKQCFIILLTGNKEDARIASKKVRKSLYSSKGRDEFKDIKKEIESAPRTYNSIVEDWRREYFVRAISVIYFLHDGGVELDFLFPWFFELLQNDSGIIRYSAVKMISTELGPLTYHLRSSNNNHDKSKVKIYDTILRSLFRSLYLLARASWDDKYKKYKYLDKLPSCKLKSAEMLLAKMQDMCGDEYIEKLEQELGIYRQ